jgi:hypothetical protein
LVSGWPGTQAARANPHVARRDRGLNCFFIGFL